MRTITIDKALVDSINSTLDKGLVRGLGVQNEGQMCVEALICFKLGLPHSDNPPCVGQEVRKVKIALNDCNWSSNQARANGMRKLAIAQLNSITLDQEQFCNTLKLISTKRILPYIIQKHYDETKNEELLIYKSKFEKLTQLDDNLWEKFYHDYKYSKYYKYYKYYYNHDYDDYYFYFYYSHCFNNYYNDDELLLIIADCILQTLTELKCEGVNFI